MSPTRAITLTCAAIFMLLAAACSSQPEPPAIPPQVSLLNMQPQAVQISIDRQPVNNCGGSGEVAYTVKKEREIAHILDLGTEWRISADGSVQVLGTGVGLGTEVAARLGVTYGKRDSVERTIEIKVGPKTIVEYEIGLLDVYQVGDAQIEAGGQRASIPFRFLHDFQLVLLGTHDLPCPGTPTPVPTYTPTPAGSTASSSTTPTATANAPDTAPQAMPTATPTIAPTLEAQPAPIGDSKRCELGTYWTSGPTWEPTIAGAERTFLHCPPSGMIQYEQIAVDDELAKVEMICGQEAVDITASFDPFSMEGALLIHYKSQPIHIGDGCVVAFTVRDVQGGNIGLYIKMAGPSPPVVDADPVIQGCGAALAPGETRTVDAGTFIVGDVVIAGTRQHDYRERENTVAFFERPASVYAEWGAACYRGIEDLMSLLITKQFSEGCQPDNGCTKVRVVYVRADGTQQAYCQYPDNSQQPIQHDGSNSWCP